MQGSNVVEGFGLAGQAERLLALPGPFHICFSRTQDFDFDSFPRSSSTRLSFVLFQGSHLLIYHFSGCWKDLEPGLEVEIPHIHRNRSTIRLSRTFWRLCIPMIQRIVGHPSSCLTRQWSSRYHEVQIFCMRTSLLCRASLRYRNQRSGVCHLGLR